ncbi:Immunoglobulin superfamily member 10 [Taenia solium]|eukprot:TsM_000354200 transcript=TsM_000354200 gene=TsM_000354200
MRSLHHQESLKVQQGQEVVLSCVVMGRPAPLISWYVNNTQQLGLWNVATGRGVIHKNKRKSRLQISNTQPIDSGNYSCLAENVNGYIKKTVEIYVVPRPQTTPLPWTTLPPLTEEEACLFYLQPSTCPPLGSPVCDTCSTPAYDNRFAPVCATGISLALRHKMYLGKDLGAKSSSMLSLLPSRILQSHRRQTFMQSHELAGSDPGNKKSMIAVPPNTMEQDVNSPKRYQGKQRPFNLNARLILAPIPVNCYDSSDRSPESLSRVCTPPGHLNSYVHSPTTVSWREDIHCTNIATIVSTPATIGNRHPLTSALPPCTSTVEESTHLPQLTS